MADTTTNKTSTEANRQAMRERNERVSAAVRTVMTARIAEILSADGIGIERATSIADTFISEYVRINREERMKDIRQYGLGISKNTGTVQA